MRIQMVGVALCVTATCAAQNITVQVDGKAVGSQSTINFLPGRFRQSPWTVWNVIAGLSCFNGVG